MDVGPPAVPPATDFLSADRGEAHQDLFDVDASKHPADGLGSPALFLDEANGEAVLGVFQVQALKEPLFWMVGTAIDVEGLVVVDSVESELVWFRAGQHLSLTLGTLHEPPTTPNPAVYEQNMGTVKSIAVFFLGLFIVLTLVVFGMTIDHAIHKNLAGVIIGLGFTVASLSGVIRFGALVHDFNKKALEE